jgi:chitodextrinase
MKLSVPFRTMIQRAWPGRLASAVLLCWSLPATLPAAVSYVQSNSADPQTPQTTVNVTFTAAQTAGNLNIVVVGWNDSTATVAIVTDSKSNAYQVAVGPTVQSGVASQSIYYAKNIVAAAAGSNIVKVTFASAAAFPDIRILEYSGADLVNPVDVTAAAIGNSSSSDSGPATTINATDLIFGANLVQTGTTAAGAGFTRRLLTSPDGDIAEDRSVTAVGSYNATAPVSPSGQWIMQMVAIRTPGSVDITPPTAPTNLTATAVSASQINLSWTASTDNVGVTQYLVESCLVSACTVAQIGTSTGTTFNNTGLASGTSYSYRVRATDAAGNLSAYSNGAIATTQTPPTTPGIPTLTVVSTTQINLSWAASTSTVGLANYIVQRCAGANCNNFAQVGTPSGTTLNDTGLTAGASYSYQVQAKDTSGNLSAFSTPPATAITQTPPTTPGTPTLTVVSTTQINLNWAPSTSTVGLANYIVQRCQGAGCNNFAQIASFAATTTAFSDTGLTQSTTYLYRVQASDTSGNLSAFSNTSAPATTQGPPTAPSNLTLTVASATQINLSWTASSSSIGLANYIVQRCQGVNCASVPANFTQAGTPTGTTFNDTGLTSGTSYSYQVQAKDTAGNLSGFSNTSTTVTQTPPTSPGTPTLTVVSATQINLSWTASTSTVGLANYIVQRCAGANCNNFAQVGTPGGTTLNDTGLTAGTSYSYQVQAKDTSGNLSAFSGIASASTQTPPTTPGIPTLTVVSATQINLSWTASTSTVGLANYIVQRCQGASCNNFAQVGTPGGTTFNDTGLTAGTSYSYQVQAKDTSGNLSAFSSVATASTQTPPTAPGTPTLTVGSNTQINLSWTASTSTVGLANYIVQRCQGGGCSNFAQVGTPAGTTFNDTGLTASTSYSYRVQASDTSGNLSAFSNTNTTTTTGPPTAPTNLTAAAAGTNQINLSWTASTSSVGLANYIVQRCQGTGCNSFTQVATPSATTHNDTGLTPNTSYSYQVQAVDTAGGLSPFSNVATAVTQAVVTTITFVQSNATDPQTSPTSASVTFTSAQTAGDLIVVAAGWNNSTATISSVNDTSGNAYQPAVGPTVQAGVATQSIYYAKNIKAAAAGANTVTVTFSAAAAFPDIRVLEYKGADPVSPIDVTAAATGNSTSSNSGSATTTNPTDLIFGANLVQTATTGAGASFTSRIITSPDADIAEDRMVTATGSYSAIAPVNPAGQWIMQMVAIRTGSAGPPQPPTAPTNLTATATSVSQINLSWTASTSSIGIANYIVQRCQGVNCASVPANFVQVATPAGTAFNDTGLAAGTSYSYQVQAKDTAGTLSAFSNVSTAVTLTPQPPTAPTNLTATATSVSQINLSWTASTSSVGLANYSVERCQGTGCSFSGPPIASPTGTTYSDTGLQTNTSYSYRVRAFDTANNPSAYSNTSSATTQTPQPPTAPTSLTASPISGNQISLSWTASTSNVGLANYIVQRCQGVNCASVPANFAQVATPAATTYTDSGLTAGTSYSYQVQAKDTSGTLSPLSNVATAIPLSGLVGAYAFNEGTGTTTVDSSGYGNNGSLINTAWTTSGRYGNALSFNGSSSYVDLGSPGQLQMPGSMTLEAWIYATGTPPDDGQIISKDSPPNASGWHLKTSADTGPRTFAVAISAPGGLYVARYSVTQVALNTWYHVAGVYNATAMTLDVYVNGVLDDGFSQGTVPASQLNPNASVNIGRRGNGFYFNGAIDEVRIYNRVLSQAEIQNDMNTPLGGGAQPLVTLSTTSLTFSNQTVGTTSSPQPVTLTNTGTAPLAISSITISSSAGVYFTQTNDCGTSVAPNANCTINVTFSPGASGPQNATLSIADNAPGSPQTVSLSGTGVVSSGLSVSPRTATLTSTLTQQFTASAGNVTWSVDGTVGGSAASGTITATGLYTPPATAGIHNVTASTTSPPQNAGATVYVSNYPGTYTRDIDKLRTGLNPNETVLTPTNVNAAQFGKLFSYSIDGTADASPLYVPNVTILGQGSHNVVYVATEHDSVYAFDADGRQAAPLWHVSFINPGAGITTVPPNDTGECCDISPEIGITGSPVIDPATNTLYVVAKTKEVSGSNTNYVHRLHALDITSGAEKIGGPISIQAVVSGTGAGSSGGQLPFLPLRENQRAALLLNNGIVYIAFGAHGDNVPYHGWVLGYNASTLQQVMVYNTSPNDPNRASGIWQSGDGLATDSTGNIFFVTGNGTFDVNTGGVDYGDSFLKISPVGVVLDYFTPHDEANMNANDLDLGSGGVILLPDQPGPHPHLAITAGKNGTIYLIDRDNFGHFNASNDNQIVQSVVNIFPNGNKATGNFKAPVYWNGHLFFSADADFLKSFQMTNGLISTVPSSQSSWVANYPGSTLGLSANGGSNGILWAIQRVDLDPAGGGVRGPGSLHAFDATNLANELYNSNQSGSRDMLDFTAKWSAPLVANGKVFVASESLLTAFGLLP